MYYWQFSKNFPLPKNGGHFEFSPKMAKHKIACISLTVRDRAILSKFSTHRVSKECTNVNFQKNFPSPKMAAIFKCSLHVFLMCNTIVRQKGPQWPSG